MVLLSVDLGNVSSNQVDLIESITESILEDNSNTLKELIFNLNSIRPQNTKPYLSVLDLGCQIKVSYFMCKYAVYRKRL